MDAVQYLMYVKKMCEEYMCDDCPIGRDAEEKGCSCDTYKKLYPSDAVRIVEEWSKDNPLQTNAQKFEEVFGKAAIHVPDPYSKEWWDEPYKEPENE